MTFIVDPSPGREMPDARITSLLKNVLKFSRSSSHHVDKKKDLGKKGEEIAAQYLQKQGFKNIKQLQEEADIRPI